MDNSSKIDAMDLLLYSAMPYVQLKEVDDYSSANSSVELSQKEKNKIYRRINRERTYREKHITYRPTFEMMKRIAAAVLIVVSLSFAAVMSVEAVRTALWNAIIEWYENSIFVKYENTDEIAAPGRILEYKEPILGDDFTRYQSRKDEQIFLLEYENSAGTVVITYRQQLLHNFETWLSNNNTEMKNIEVNGYNGISTTLVIEGIEFNSILWYDDNYAYKISGNISINELLNLAKALTVVEYSK